MGPISAAIGRAWYRRALENPSVEVTMDGVRGDYLAVPA